jgi:hypothetical protein
LKNKDNIRKPVKSLIIVIHITTMDEIYKTSKNITRKNITISYKINKEKIKIAVNIIDKNEQLTMGVQYML